MIELIYGRESDRKFMYVKERRVYICERDGYRIYVCEREG